MALVPVPRWLPVRTFVNFTYNLDALPADWAINGIPASSLMVENAYYQARFMSPQERAAGLETEYRLGPSNGIGIWRNVPDTDWGQLNPSRLYEVTVHKSRLEQQQGGGFIYDGLWRHPEWWGMSASTLQAYFNQKAIPYTLEDLPDLSDGQQGALEDAQARAGWREGGASKGWATIGYGHPQATGGPLLTLLTGAENRAGLPAGQECLSVNRLDIAHVRELVRLGPPWMGYPEIT
ncbi:hypothetical protein [Hymenobacter metallicola]|uniref:Uncharacterized protein n=1 Tax=Hymenobacter metallicola TaxID=2563114 RepID=A0A4Z0QL76_9BACT|nr:hypothetical protein [Hymenobacter metallicola]TGE29801.1 hypothetical protein E5K02_10180 [Hymenobacter metallicola]